MRYVFKFRRILVLGSLFLFCLLANLSLASVLWPAEAPASWPPKGYKIRCPVVRDTFVSTVGKERFGNNGASRRLKVKGIQEFALFDIDPSVLKGKIIAGALLHVRSASPREAPLLRIGVSMIASPWVEGRSRGYYPERGASCFNQAMYELKDWSYEGSTLMDVVFGRGHTIWRFADSTPPDKEGWQTVAVEPDVVSARVAGLSYGFCMADEVGHQWSLNDHEFRYVWFPNRFFFSRERKGSEPWMEVWIYGEDHVPPEPVTSVQVSTEGLPPGEALVSWETPKDTGGGHVLGFVVDYARKGSPSKPMPRYLIPMAGKPGEEVRMHIHGTQFAPGDEFKLTIRPIDSAGNRGKPYSRLIRLSSSRCVRLAAPTFKAFRPSLKLPEVGGLKVTVVDLLDKIDPRDGHMIPAHEDGYKGGNHLFSAKKGLIRLQVARNEAVSFQVNLEGKSPNVSMMGWFPQNPELKVKIFQFAYVKVRNKSGKIISILPDPLIPLKGNFSIPSKAGRVMVPGQENHSLICEIYVPHDEQPGRKEGKLVISSGRERLELKIKLTVWNFTLPDKLSFIPEMNAYGTTSPYRGYDYYRLAHEHRTCLNVLPYNWAGKPSFAPKWVEDHFEWGEWDEKVGPLLDGSAFKGLPREGEPVDVFYLPFNENWPVEIHHSYKPSYWADEAFTVKYKEDLGKAFAAFARHCNEMGWHDTIFEFYLNNKIYFRKRFSKCSAPWIFDEPVNTQDFWALRWYGLLWHHAVNPVMGLAKMWFRADISYTQFARNTLWGITDIEYLGGINAQKVRMKREENLLYEGSCFSEYGSPNRIDEANTQPVLWCISAWCNGAIGVLPWQTIGGKQCWDTAEQTALFYPDHCGPKPSVRLKAFRRGQEDVEYLMLLCRTYGYTDHEVAGWVKKIFPMNVGPSQNGVDPALLWRMRYEVGEAISRKAATCHRELEKKNLLIQGLEKPPEPGYVSVAPKVEPYRPDCRRWK